jgi:hypothetical protein
MPRGTAFFHTTGEKSGLALEPRRPYGVGNRPTNGAARGRGTAWPSPCEFGLNHSPFSFGWVMVGGSDDAVSRSIRERSHARRSFRAAGAVVEEEDRRFNAGLQWKMLGRTSWALIWLSERSPVPRGSSQSSGAVVGGGSRVSFGGGVRWLDRTSSGGWQTNSQAAIASRTAPTKRSMSATAMAPMADTRNKVVARSPCPA